MTVKKLSFSDGTDMGDVGDTICLAALCSAILHGEGAVQMAFAYTLGLDSRTAVIRYDDTIAGLDAGMLAVGLCVREYGEDKIVVSEINQPAPAGERGQDG